MQNIQLNNVNQLSPINNESLEEDKNPIIEPAVFQKTAWKEPSLKKNRSIEEFSKRDFTAFGKKTSIDDSVEDRPLSSLVFSSDEENPRSPVLTFIKTLKPKEKEEGEISPLVFSSNEKKPKSLDQTFLNSTTKKEKRKREISPFDLEGEPFFKQLTYPLDEVVNTETTLFDLQSQNEKRPPEIRIKDPYKNRRTPFRGNSTSVELKITRMNKSGMLERNSKHFPINPISDARGSFMQAFEITSPSPQLVDEIPNNQVIIKTFHEQTPGKNNQSRLENFMRNSIAQYSRLLAKGNIPIAKVYNIDTAIEDQYYIMEYLPHEVPISFWKNPDIKFEDLTSDIQSLLREVRNFMELMLNESIDMDLKPSNFRLNAQGLLFLIDFTEEPNIDPIHVNLSQALRLWSNENQNICNFLKENLNHNNFKDLTVENQYRA